ncbi:MAG: response regulator [Gemmataceae bacterium]|nr:response regulator [Gemmataceae bacterium]
MNILIGWEDAEQVDLIAMYLGAGENKVYLANDPVHFREIIQNGTLLDVVVLSTRYPDLDHAFDLFKQVRAVRPELPIMCGCKPDDIYRLARYMMGGMKSYMLRDPNGDFLFLLNAMVESVVESVRAEREQKVAEKLREEVESVRKLQETIIPKNIKPPKGYRICARYEPSQVKVVGGQPVTMAGGDYYDLFPLKGDRFVVIVGDASGHGMKACMSVITMHTLVRMLKDDEHLNPAEFVATVNRNLCEQTVVSADGGFITMAYGVLHSDTNEFHWCSAGHPPPFIQSLDTGKIHMVANEDVGGMPLGLFDTAEYEQHIFNIPPRSRVLLFTDGLQEAFPENGGKHQVFGNDGIMATLARTIKQPIEKTLAALFDDSNAFTQGAGRHDDTSGVLIERFE